MSLSMGSVAGFTRADLHAVEKEQMRRLLEHPLPHSMQASQAIIPIMSLADGWSPLPACDDALAVSAGVSDHSWSQLRSSPQPQLLPDDEPLPYLSPDTHALLHRKQQLSPPASPPSDFAFAFPNALNSYSAASDCYASFAPAAAAASRKRGLEDDELGLSSFLQRSISSTSASSTSDLHLLSAPLPASLSSKKLSSSSSSGVVGERQRAAYPLLSSAVVDGFFASSVNMSGSIMGGLDDSELGLLPPDGERQTIVKTETSNDGGSTDAPIISSSSIKVKQPSMPHMSASSWLPSPPLPVLSPSRSSPLSSSLSSAASCVSSKASVSSSFSAHSHHALPAPAAASSSASIADPDLDAEDDGESGGEGGRRAKRRLTDKQRRAKIKDGLEQLRSLVALHGSSSSDQAAIVNSSVDLVQQLVNEKDQLRQQVRLLRDERADIEREQRALRMTAAAVLSSSSSSSSSALHSADVKQPNLGFLFQHLLNVLNANTGGDGRSSSGSGGGGLLGEGGEVTASIDQLLLSQYFLQTLQNVNKTQRNNSFDAL